MRNSRQGKEGRYQGSKVRKRMITLLLNLKRELLIQRRIRLLHKLDFELQPRPLILILRLRMLQKIIELPETQPKPRS